MTPLLVARVRRVVRRQSGFTLIEVMVAAGLLAIVLVAILAVADTSNKLAPKDAERGNVIQETQAGLHRMTRELRQAHELVAADSAAMDVRVLVQGSEQQVAYRCNEPHPTNPDWRRCLRFAGGEPEVVVDRVLNGTEVFEYTRTAPDGPITYVRAKVEVPAKGDLKEGHGHNVVLDDGFYMRNSNLR